MSGSLAPSIRPAFFDHLAPRFDETALAGGDEGWLASLAKFRSDDGFGEELWVPAIPETLLAIRVAGAPVTSEVGRVRQSGPRRNLALQPANLPNHYHCQGPVLFFHMYLPDALLDRGAEAAGVPALSGRLRDDLVFVQDPILERRLLDCAHSAFGGGLPSALEMEGHTLLVLDRLIALHGAKPSRTSGSGLARWQVRRVIEFLDAHVAEDVPLSALARLVGLSPNHFCTAFRVSLGEPPHRWLVRHRIERAKEMLADPGLSITGVALAAGFGSSAHFATAFRKEVGVTPRRYRRERLL